MIIYHSETLWLNGEEMCSLEYIAETSGLTLDELQNLVDLGVLIPRHQDQASQPLFEVNYVMVARSARRLRDDFELDQHGLAVALNLLKRIHALEFELAKKTMGNSVNALTAMRGSSDTSLSTEDIIKITRDEDDDSSR